MGEPLLDIGLEKKQLWLNTYPNIKVGMTTNGQLLIPKKDILCKYINVLKISNYGFAKKLFETVHRGSLKYEGVKASIEEFLSIPRENRLKTIISFLILEENGEEENAWKDYWEGKCEELYIWLPHNWAGYRESHIEQIREKCRSCGKPDVGFTVSANGDVSARCWDFNRELTVGNLNGSSFKEIYEGRKLKGIMEMHKEKRFLTVKICVSIVINCMTERMH